MVKLHSRSKAVLYFSPKELVALGYKFHKWAPYRVPGVATPACGGWSQWVLC